MREVRDDRSDRLTSQAVSHQKATRKVRQVRSVSTPEPRRVKGCRG